LITAVLYVASLWFLLAALGWQPKSEYGLILLLAVSFEPFLFECWLGGQLSAIAFASLALCFAALKTGRSFTAGLLLGLCFYKPTILLLVLPMLVIGRQWRMLLGMTVTGVILAMLSWILVGWDVSINYLNVLLSFQQSTSRGDLEIRTWKYVDLNNCLRMLFGHHNELRTALLVLLGLIPFAMLARLWWRHGPAHPSIELWATTITWVPLLNAYFGIYDSILIVQSLLLTAFELRRRTENSRPLNDSGFAYLILGIWIAPWFSQPLARITGIPVYSLLLAGLGVFQRQKVEGKRQN
jgi:hypothetical protein